jgi:hypothetical protein
MMSEYRNDPTIDFMLDKDSKDSEDYANRYDQHIHAMTAERLNSKSDIAWELTIRDQRIAELEEQNKWLDELLQDMDSYLDSGNNKTAIYQTSLFHHGIKEVLASMEPRKLTGYESEALNNALTASSKLVGKGMEKDDE